MEKTNPDQVPGDLVPRTPFDGESIRAGLPELDPFRRDDLRAVYVADHVELGYATTFHRAQGRTTDTAHVVVSPVTTRELLYVAATRGRESNRLWDFDDDAIGLLTGPPPDLTDLGHDLSRLYRWLADLDDEERTVAQCRPQDRNLILRLLGDLPGGRLTGTR